MLPLSPTVQRALVGLGHNRVSLTPLTAPLELAGNMSNVMCSSMARMSLGCRHSRQQPQLQQARPAFGFGCSMRGQALTCE